MLYKKGDKIAFLNELLKGVVVDCISPSQVLVECKGIEMSVSVSEIIRVTHIPKVEGKRIFPVKKADRSIDEFPNLERNATYYNKLNVGDLVSFMGDNSKGKVVAILSDNNYTQHANLQVYSQVVSSVRVIISHANDFFSHAKNRLSHADRMRKLRFVLKTFTCEVACERP